MSAGDTYTWLCEKELEKVVAIIKDLQYQLALNGAQGGVTITISKESFTLVEDALMANTPMLTYYTSTDYTKHNKPHLMLRGWMVLCSED